MNGLLALLIGFSGVRDPNSAEPIRFAGSTVRVTLQQDGSDDVGDGSDLAAMQASLQVWSDLPCADFRFELDGMTGSRADGDDGQNLITFRESSWPGGANGAVGFTIRYRNTGTAPQTWDGGDVLLNGVDNDWSTTGDVRRFDIQSVVTHELGHVLGLQHSARPESTMYFGTRAGVTYGRTLQPDDVSGVCYLYPGAGASCQNDADCPLLFGLYGGGDLRMNCAGGACTVGDADLYGAECLGGGDCAGVCTNDPERTSGGDPDFCSMNCASNAECGGDLCSGNRCFVGRDDCLQDTDCPGNNNVCLFDLDGRFRCRGLCLLDEHCGGGGLVCHGGTGMNPPGFCRPPGPNAAGASCDHGLECASLRCTGGGATPICEGAPLVPGQDAGMVDTGGPTVDSGVAPPDAGPPADGGLVMDAQPAADVGGGVPDRGRTDKVTGGCGCSAGRKTGSGPWMLLLLLTVMLRRRW